LQALSTSTFSVVQVCCEDTSLVPPVDVICAFFIWMTLDHLELHQALQLQRTAAGKPSRTQPTSYIYPIYATPEITVSCVHTKTWYNRTWTALSRRIHQRKNLHAALPLLLLFRCCCCLSLMPLIRFLSHVSDRLLYYFLSYLYSDFEIAFFRRGATLWRETWSTRCRIMTVMGCSSRTSLSRLLYICSGARLTKAGRHWGLP
jgi:hypothetical protein